MVDFFSGGGGMSCGFSRRAPFKLIASVDAEHAKPCEGFGRLDCNDTYEANIGVSPMNRDIGGIDPKSILKDIVEVSGATLKRGDLTVMLCCPPCTDFSRAKPTNHTVDSPKNTLVAKCADIVEAMLPEFVLMENSRELIMGNYGHHYRSFVKRLEGLGYSIRGDVHVLTRFGLPQIRERALVVAARDCEARTLEDLWEGWTLRPEAITVRHALSDVDPSDPMHVYPGFASDIVRRRIDAIPRDGGSWFDLATHPERDELLIESMKSRLARNDLGSHPDVYGRMWWDRPAPTIKRECAHVGNGRYCHPDENRLLTVREMATLQGFPADFQFKSRSVANRYRHIGDAVPPIISYQLSALIQWMKTGKKPKPEDWIMPHTSLKVSDVVPAVAPDAQRLLFR